MASGRKGKSACFYYNTYIIFSQLLKVYFVYFYLFIHKVKSPSIKDRDFF